MRERVRITDVAPRDGLQNEPLRPDGKGAPPAEVLNLIAAISASGVNEVEVTSFVSPKWVPQFANAPGLLLVLARFVAHQRATQDAAPLPGYSVLVPNMQGLTACLEAQRSACASAGIDGLLSGISVFTAASETFSRKNINATIDESIGRFGPVVPEAQNHRLTVRAYVSCAIACPYEGPIAPAAVAATAEKLAALGVDEIDLGDTIGAGQPDTVRAMITAVVGALGPRWLARLVLHFHDTYGAAALCVREALDLGIRAFDGSVGGLGGCPYASRPGKPAPGNIATELLVKTIHDAGYVTSVDPSRLALAGEAARFLVAGNRTVAGTR